MIVSDLYPTIRRLLMGRTVSDANLAEYTRKGIIEISENFKFPKLQKTGSIVQFIPFVNNYDPNYFKDVGDVDLEVNKINSFFLYLNTSATPNPYGNLTAAGYNLTFKTIDTLEVLTNIPGIPIYWTRFEGRI